MKWVFHYNFLLVEACKYFQNSQPRSDLSIPSPRVGHGCDPESPGRQTGGEAHQEPSPVCHHVNRAASEHPFLIRPRCDPLPGGQSGLPPGETRSQTCLTGGPNTRALWHAAHALRSEPRFNLRCDRYRGAPQCVSHPSVSSNVLRRTSMTTISQPVEGYGMMFAVLVASRGDAGRGRGHCHGGWRESVFAFIQASLPGDTNCLSFFFIISVYIN